MTCESPVAFGVFELFVADKSQEMLPECFEISVSRNNVLDESYKILQEVGMGRWKDGKCGIDDELPAAMLRLLPSNSWHQLSV